MRVCGTCHHENAEHLGFCVQCGRRLPGTEPLAVARATGGSSRQNTLLPTTLGGAAVVEPPAVALRRPRPNAAAVLRWMRGSVAYVFTHLRGRIDTVRRRRALEAERSGEQRLLRRAVADLGAAVRAESIQPSALSGLLESVRGAERRRDAAAASLSEAERLLVEEDARLAAEEQASGTAVRHAEAALAGAEESLRSVVVERQALAAQARDAAQESAAAGDVGSMPTIGLPQGTGTRAAELEARTVALRAEVEHLRTELQSARVRLDAAGSARRTAARDLAVSLAGRRRDRNDAEQHLASVLEQLGDAALSERPASPTLDPLYQRINQLAQTVVLREQQLQELARALERPDPARLIVGVLLILVPLLGAVALWSQLK